MTTIPIGCLTKEQVKDFKFRFYWQFGTDPIYRVAKQLFDNIPEYRMYKYVHRIEGPTINIPVKSPEEAYELYQKALEYFNTPAGSWYWDDSACGWSNAGLEVWDEDLKDWTNWYKDMNDEEGEFPDCFEEEDE